MIAPIVICSRRNSDVDWDDLDLAVRSMLHYTPADVWVFWQQVDGGPGPQFDWSDAGSGVRLVPQPDDIDTFGAAYEYAMNRVLLDTVERPDGLVLANDDVVLRPDTWDLLAEDVEALVEGEYRPAMVATRANYVRHVQRELGPVDEVLEVREASPLFAWVDTHAAVGVNWPHCNWYSDDVLCHDWRSDDWRVFVSRAWVHHVGERSTRANGETHEDLQEQGLAWVREHRPDVAEALGVA